MPPPSYTTSRTGTPEAGAVEIDTTPILAESRTIKNDQKQEGEKPGSTENICVKHKSGIFIGVLLLVGLFLVQKGMTKTVTTTAVATEAVTTTDAVSTTKAITTKDAAPAVVTGAEAVAKEKTVVTTATTTEAVTATEAVATEQTVVTNAIATEDATASAVTATEAVAKENTATVASATSATTVATAVEVCVPGQIMMHEKQLDYCGNKSKAKDDNDCWMWDKTVYWDKYPLFQNMLIKDDGQAHNYCRNPSPSQSKEAWCYTGVGFWKWEYCGITASKVA